MTFENDGCTGWFDSWGDLLRNIGIQIETPSWRHCCDDHDWVMHNNSDLIEFALGGVELGWCVSQVDAFMGIVMGIGVLSPVALYMFVFGNKKKGR